jgi:hypothetical protein
VWEMGDGPQGIEKCGRVGERGRAWAGFSLADREGFPFSFSFFFSLFFSLIPFSFKQIFIYNS